MNPSVPESFIAQAYEDDAASAAAEYGANFRTDVEALFSREAISALTVPNRIELPKAFSAKYVAYCDPSGGSSDSMTLAIAHVEDEVVVLDAIRERRPPFSPEDVVEEFCGLLRSYGIKSVKGDKYAGMWPREQFAKRGVHYQTAEKTTSDTYLEFLPMVNAGRVQLLDHKRLITQLTLLERRTSRTNKDTVSHPPHGHDNIATAVAGVAVNASVGAQKTTRVIPLWQIFQPADAQIDDADENFRQAEAAFRRGQLKGRDLAWFVSERARRKKASR